MTETPQRAFVPGYEQPCANCVFRDFYEIHKTAKDQSVLLTNMRNQLIAVTKELESLKPVEEEIEEPEVEDLPEEQ